MPCFTHALTRHPDAADGSGSAALASPVLRALRRSKNAFLASSLPALVPAENIAAIVAANAVIHGLRPRLRPPPADPARSAPQRSFPATPCAAAPSAIDTPLRTVPWLPSQT